MPKPNNLFPIRMDHLVLLQAIEDGDGEVTPEIERALQIKERELQECAVSLAYVVKNLEATEETIDNEIKRLQKLKESAKKRIKFFKDSIAAAMNQFHVESINGDTIKLSFRSAKSVLIEDDRLVPPEYWEQPPPEIRKTKIKEAIQEGKTVPGASITSNRHLQIR